MENITLENCEINKIKNILHQQLHDLDFDGN